jgi:hypothetical protein
MKETKGKDMKETKGKDMKETKGKDMKETKGKEIYEASRKIQFSKKDGYQIFNRNNLNYDAYDPEVIFLNGGGQWGIRISGYCRRIRAGLVVLLRRLLSCMQIEGL